MKLLIVDDHHLFLEGMRYVLRSLDPNMVIVEAHSAKQALDLASEHENFDMVLLDINLPDSNGFTALSQLNRHNPLLPIIVLSASEDPGDIQRALEEGAMGFIPKSSTADIMLSAMQLVQAGGVYVPSCFMKSDTTSTTTHAGHSGSVATLTPRQLEVLGLLLRGDSNKQIAQTLGLTEPTIKAHVTAILKALGVTNRTQAALAAESLGLFRR